MSYQKPNLKFLKDAILSVLKTSSNGMNYKQLSWKLNLKGSEYKKIISRAIKELKKDSLLIESKSFKYRINSPQINGIIEINSSGNGYVVSDELNDVFIAKSDMLNALNGDTVSVKIIKNNRKKLFGKIIFVVKRNQSKFIGSVVKNNGNHFFIPNNTNTGAIFFIPPQKLNGASKGSRVIVELIDWNSSETHPTGHVISKLSSKHSLREEIRSIVEIFNLRTSFSSAVMQEVKRISNTLSDKDVKGRKDFRQCSTFTIDPAEAKDFDDAISIKYSDSGGAEVGIHIADVGHYVSVNSQTDKEAFLRAFSVYFPGQVIPMLPERVSNKICSLNQNEDKLCFSVVINFDKDLQTVMSTWIGKTIINSNYRFTYDEVERLIINNEPGKFKKELTSLYNISKKLRKKRMEDGSIDFERTETSFKLNKVKEPVKLIKKESLSSHKLIEEFMLLANKVVANKLSHLKQSIYRVHDIPDKDKLNELSIYLNEINKWNVNFNTNHKKLHSVINRLLKEKNHSVDKKIIVNLILQTMAKANYSTKNIGHYGLGFPKYTHFTSPIRRYADLVVHRLLEQVVCKKSHTLIDLEKQCAHFSKIEKTYTKIERKTIKFIQLMLLKKSVGTSLMGVITGLAKWGIYVDVNDGHGEGLVLSKELINYYHNPIKRAFINRKTGKKYILGQHVLVEIISICLSKQEMDLKIIE